MAQRNPFVIIVGPARHGKTTLRRTLARVLGEKGGSCSDFLYSIWSLIDQRGEEALRALPKEDSRPLLVALGDWLTTPAASGLENFPHHLFPGADMSWFEASRLPKPSPSALIQAAYQSGIRVLDGVRRKQELDACLPYFSWFGEKPIVIWIENPRKELVPGDNLDIPPSCADEIVINSGTEGQLEDIAYEIARKIWAKSNLDA